MESNNEQPFKISVSSMNGIAFIVMIVNVISERLGHILIIQVEDSVKW